MKFSEISKLDKAESTGHQTCASPNIPDDLSPYTVYIILKELFGEPNSDFDPTRSQWAYTLKVPGAIIEIYDWKLCLLHLHVCAESSNHEEVIHIGKEFVEFLQKQAQKYSKKIKSAAEETHSYVLQNPFGLYYKSAKNIMAELEQINPDESRSDMSILEDFLQVEDLHRSAFFLLIASFEGFLNLVYELYIKPELKDERIFDRLSREQIDIKLRLAPVYCNCFKSELISSESEPFKKFHSIINLRNDFIHANLTKAMKIPIIIDDDRKLMHFPVMRDKFGFPKSIDELKINDLQLIKESIDAMIDILLQDMKPRHKREFKEIMDKQFILIDSEDDEVFIVGGDDYIS